MSKKEKIKLDNIEDAIESIRKGEVIIVVDDENRENEGDFLAAAEKITPTIINFMAKEGRGLICVPLSEKRCKEIIFANRDKWFLFPVFIHVAKHKINGAVIILSPAFKGRENRLTFHVGLRASWKSKKCCYEKYN